MLCFVDRLTATAFGAVFAAVVFLPVVAVFAVLDVSRRLLRRRSSSPQDPAQSSPAAVCSLALAADAVATTRRQIDNPSSALNHSNSFPNIHSRPINLASLPTDNCPDTSHQTESTAHTFDSKP